MELPGFVDLVGAIAERMGQRPDSVRVTPDGVLLHTSDGFLFAFLEDATRVSLASIERLLEEPAGRAGRLVLLTPDRLPLALAEAAQNGRASVVEHERFRELVRGLDLGERLGEEPRGPHDVPGNRLLPSARHLDAVVARARTWLEWGVPALALRFYRQALAQKPAFTPARIGVGRSLAALGLPDEALATLAEVLRDHPDDIDARLAQASVFGQTGRRQDEMKVYRTLLTERPDRDDVRAQLIAAEVEDGAWIEARDDLEQLLARVPEDPRLRFLHAAALERTGADRSATAERERARDLGLSHEDEVALSAHVGLPAPPPRPAGTRGAPDRPDAGTPEKPPGSPRARRPRPGRKRK